ncbi:hypothetical protein [Enterococcus mundtii]|uniref:hypothetical protein n=1 Tax=Enterococcus mundtii TaxID=53346 RepID=UPI001A973A51|nr:hypothetical protein [Enterococcus mundtii]MBO1087132.1 hypothetical protein [Enterococcus mundtii]
MKYETKTEAAKAWLAEWNQFPQWIIEKMIGENFENWMNLTPFTVGDEVRCSYDEEQLTDSTETYTILSINKEEETAKIEVDNQQVTVDLSDLERSEEKEFLPMWSTLFEMSDPCDYDWIGNHLYDIADCGINIYKYDDGENEMYLLGIDGAGYDFYEHHWLPLYEKRGLQWHTKQAI